MLQVSTTFEFVPARDSDERPRLEYAEPVLGFEGHDIAFSIEGELVLIDPCCDGFSWFWVGTP